MYIDSEYWPDTYKQFLDDVTPSKEPNPFSKTLEFNSTLLGGYPAYETVTQDKIVRTLTFDLLVGQTWYKLTYMSKDMSNLLSFLKTMKRMTDSFQLCKSESSSHMKQPIPMNHLSLPVNSNSLNFSNYSSPAFKVSLRSPSSWHINQSLADRKIVLSSPSSNISFFKQDDSVVRFMLGYNEDASYLSRRNLTLEHYSYFVISNLKKDLVGFHLYEWTPILLHDYPAFRATYSYFDPITRSSVREMDITTLVNNHQYDFSYYGKMPWYQHFFPVIEHVLDSIAFKP